AQVYIEQGPPGIKSENARLNGWTFIDIENVDVGGYVEEAREVVQAQLDLPAGYSVTWAGQYEYMQRAKAKLTYVVPLTLMLIVVLLYMNFRSFAEVFIIILTLPLAMVGGVTLMWLEGYNFSVATAVGFIALAGVAAETGVIMLQYLKQSYQEQAAKVGAALSRQQLSTAILEGASLRVRPVMMTAIATIVGLVPVMYGTGTGSEVMSRIAAPMVGGMVTAVLLTLMVLPVLYSLWLRWRPE
ncbi:MAG: efflux RND transporter permease subunit, partial [Ketobacter sp.]